MFEFDWYVYVGLAIAAFSAGLIDAMVGGGGLIQIPALFGLMPNVNHATLFGTNKLSSVVGTSYAAHKYSKLVRIPWNSTLPAALSAFPGAVLGAYLVTHVSGEFLRLLLPVLLAVVAVYTFINKDLGSKHLPKLTTERERVVGILLGFTVGFYDGFFGPGTGSFLVVGFVVLFGFDFLSATAGAKLVNVVCNLSALIWFVPSGHVLIGIAAGMAFFNLIGSRVGALLAIKKGSAFIRKVLLIVVCILILKTSYDSYFPLLWF